MNPFPSSLTAHQNQRPAATKSKGGSNKNKGRRNEIKGERNKIQIDFPSADRAFSTSYTDFRARDPSSPPTSARPTLEARAEQLFAKEDTYHEFGFSKSVVAPHTSWPGISGHIGHIGDTLLNPLIGPILPIFIPPLRPLSSVSCAAGPPGQLGNE
jgi:hypothetical protein